ncbi:MAG: selenocysteine-specific translation elongation factor [Pirellulales bacterium]|nr:selenocysteine-specific translation elongation factor [Pirellulales bacterium]
MATDLILGTAGHIDHGKTSLVRALTGTDTDRLPEEKKRGITIELGFASLEIGDFRLGVVDVPGHERFVRNMLAGATGMDLAMLVVAADDSVKPQTREHLEILRLLDLPVGVIALTKCDLADVDWVDMVEQEVRELVEGTFLENSPIIRTSAATSEGLDELRTALTTAATEAAARHSTDGPFRMAIDRSFTMTGHGTVVTGSVASGEAHVGDQLVIEPGEVAVRVRSIENHGSHVDQIHRGQRAAINLAGIHHDEVQRGQQLASVDHLRASRRLTVRLDLLKSAQKPLGNRSRVRLHMGTAEIMASVRLLDCDKLMPSESALAQLVLSEPVAATWRQPLVIRRESPVTTLGGGIVLDPEAPRIHRPNETTLRLASELISDDANSRAAAAAFFFGLRAWQATDLVRAAGIADYEQAVASLLKSETLIELRLSNRRTRMVHMAALEQACAHVESCLDKLHDRDMLSTLIAVTQLKRRVGRVLDDDVFDALLDYLAKKKRIRRVDQRVQLAGRGPQLSANEQKLLNEIVERFAKADLASPSVKEVQEQATRNRQVVPKLVDLAVTEGQLVRISPEILFHADTERRVRGIIVEELTDGDGLTLSQIRELLGTTRKYAVPLCEYLDREGVTRRDGDLRRLGPVGESLRS